MPPGRGGGSRLALLALLGGTAAMVGYSGPASLPEVPRAPELPAEPRRAGAGLSPEAKASARRGGGPSPADTVNPEGRAARRRAQRAVAKEIKRGVTR